MEKAFNFGATTLYRAFNRGRTYPEQQQHKKDLRLAQEKAQAIEQRPAPLPQTRIKLSQSDLSFKDPQQSQPSCLLFQKLPPEIRAHVWEEVLGGSILRFETVNKGVMHTCMPLPFARHRFSSTSARELDCRQWDDDDDDELGQFLTVDVRLLRTCHTAYAECIPILWGSNTIAMSSPLTLLYLYDYTLVPSHFTQIRHLQLQWTYFEHSKIMSSRYIADHDPQTWERFWELVAQMKLLSLGVNLGYIGSPDGKGNISTEWTKPMLKVQGVRNVCLVLEGLTRPSDGFQGNEQLAREISRTWMSGA